MLSIATSIIISIGGVGLYLIYSHTRLIAHSHSEAHRLIGLIDQGLSVFRNRSLTSMVQIIGYLSLLLFVLSQFIAHPLPIWPYLLAFVLGGSIMSAIGVGIQPIFIRLLPVIIQHANRQVSPSLITTYSACVGIGLVSTSALLLGLIGCYAWLGATPLVGYGVGCVVVAFVWRIAGGIFKPAANIVAERTHSNGISDGRNVATILDTMGDFIGSFLGFGIDILSAFVFAIIGCCLFAISLYDSGVINPETYTLLMALPFMIVAISMCIGFCSYVWARYRLHRRPNNILLETLYITVGISAFVIYVLINNVWVDTTLKSVWINDQRLSLLIPYLIGLIGAIIISFTSEYMSAPHFSPNKQTSKHIECGSALTLLHALGNGFRSHALQVSYVFVIMGSSIYYAGIYGVAFASLGMVSMTPYLLALISFKALSGSLHKLSSLAPLPHIETQNIKKLYRISQTTIALGNSFNTSAATIASTGLFLALLLIASPTNSLSLSLSPSLIVGLCAGMTAPFLIRSSLVSGMVQVAIKLIGEVNRQLTDIPYLNENKASPDIATATDRACQIIMGTLVIPGLLVTLMPLVMGYTLGSNAVLGFSLGILINNLVQTYYWSNTGETLGHIKTTIATGRLGGPQSPNFSAIVRADAIGDVFRDLMGPHGSITLKCATIISALLMVLLAL
ncbi:MAG: sodium/proton-translocating pyrophosphatase [Candidatus Marinamargulisbacteria bacterium]|nr:sodium/proton-translocating pyrophosphatase [Candidatus Marinamargulisbacteria bacterium]